MASLTVSKSTEKISTLRGYKMTMFVRSKDNTDEVWNGARSGREGAINVFGADDVRGDLELILKGSPYLTARAHLQATDISMLAPRLKSILTSGASYSRPSLQPIYVDFEGVPSSSRLRPKPKTSLFDLLVPSGRSFDDADEVAALLTGSGRQVKSASKEIEKLRLIKSPAEVKVLRRAADISSDAHAQVSATTPQTSLSLTHCSISTGHALLRAHRHLWSDRIVTCLPFRVHDLTRWLRATSLRPRLRQRSLLANHPLHLQPTTSQRWRACRSRRRL